MDTFELDLVSFRKTYLIPTHIFSQLQKHQICLNPAGLGIGKTESNIQCMTSPLFLNHYTQIFYLTETHNNLLEVHDKIKLVVGEDNILVLQRRPEELCKELNVQWKDFEKRGLSYYARKHLCKKICMVNGVHGCEWIDQLSKKTITSKKIIFCVADYILVNPGFIVDIVSKCKGSKILFIIDEAKIFKNNNLGVITFKDFSNFKNILFDLVEDISTTASEKIIIDTWIQTLKKLDRNPNKSFATTLPIINWGLKLNNQKLGIRKFKDYCYIGYKLQKISTLHPDYYWYDKKTASFNFVDLIKIKNANILVTVANIPREIIKIKLDRTNIKTIVPTFGKIHPGTKVYNLKINYGSKKYFRHKSKQLFDLFAQMISKNIRNSETTLLITNKEFINFVREKFESVLKKLCGENIIIVTDSFERYDLSNPFILPLISYGICGLNAFQQIKNVICLSSYYINDDILNDKINELLPEFRKIRFTIGQDKKGNRVAIPSEELVSDSENKYLCKVANDLLYMFETAITEQVVGRIRFITNSRTVLLQNNSKFSFFVHKEFSSLKEVRRHFGLKTHRDSTYSKKKEETLELQARGIDMDEIIKKLGISRATYYRYIYISK
ncbi:MAG: hypothetical protein HQK49_17260 [Oligoflexia bacterium]|nr:hypothetical protein [Oligoflexia bacterium]